MSEEECNVVVQLNPEAEVDVKPENVPLPTDSMITVRLSDVQIHPEQDDITDMEESSRNSTTSPSRPASRTSSKESSSCDSEDSVSVMSVDWEGLEKTEEQEPRDEGTDESTTLLLARLDKENAALATNPKSGIVHPSRSRSDARPPSIQYLKKLVNGPHRQSLRYSLLPAPQMTELEFWAALVQDYPQTVERLPTLTSNKIRGGVPPPLRGVVWPSIAGAHDNTLHAEFHKLSTQPSPYDGLIGKDVGRSFPNVEMFREAGGEGQIMLGRVLKAFSLYDEKIGYCQGLGFVVGPLLMHMTEAEAFCILVRLMERYDLRSCYLPDLSGLHLRIYQYQHLLARHLPDLVAHLEHLKIEPLYVSQWFLSFFAVTCPLPMLLRIYDVILSEGATETLMRVAMSLMQRNQKKLLAFTEFEDVMQFLLSRSLWDTYAQHADDLVADFVSFTGLVTQDSLQTLEANFRQSQNLTATSSLKTAASSLLGRFWAGSAHSASKSVNLSLTIPASKPVRKTSSGHSLTSTVNSGEISTSDASTLATELFEEGSAKTGPSSSVTMETPGLSNHASSDRDFHHQIEELLTALSGMQRQQGELARELQREREEREEDRDAGRALLFRLRQQTSMIQELVGDEMGEDEVDLSQLMEKADSRFTSSKTKRLSILQSKHQLRDAAAEWKGKHDAEAARCAELMTQLDEREAEHAVLKDQLREARARVQDGHRDKQRLERTIQELRSRTSAPDSPSDVFSPVAEAGELKSPSSKPGLREFKLGKPETNRISTLGTSTFSKRTSSLHTQTVLATDNHQPVAADQLLLELVNAKTAEAVARQELEETKGKLDSLRKILSGPTTSPVIRAPGADISSGGISSSPKEATKAPPPVPASAGGFFSGWGKRST